VRSSSMISTCVTCKICKETYKCSLMSNNSMNYNLVDQNSLYIQVTMRTEMIRLVRKTRVLNRLKVLIRIHMRTKNKKKWLTCILVTIVNSLSTWVSNTETSNSRKVSQ
jgi:hypothetical protein